MGLRRKTGPLHLSVQRQNPPEMNGVEKSIDLDRIVWDPEYRDQVLEDMKMTG